MIIYKDLVTGDELFSDTYPMKYVGGNGTIVEVQGKLTTESSDFDESAIGANPSAEEEAEKADANVVSGINICLANRLQEVSAFTIKQYKKNIKEYSVRVVAKREEKAAELEEENRKPEAEKMREGTKEFKKNFSADLKELIIEPFKEKDFQFFNGESMDAEGMTCLGYYPSDDPQNRPVMYFIKHGLLEEKV